MRIVPNGSKDSTDTTASEAYVQADYRRGLENAISMIENGISGLREMAKKLKTQSEVLPDSLRGRPTAPPNAEDEEEAVVELARTLETLVGAANALEEALEEEYGDVNLNDIVFTEFLPAKKPD